MRLDQQPGHPQPEPDGVLTPAAEGGEEPFGDVGRDALTGADRQGVRTVLQLATAALNVGLNLLLIPAYSWRGAAWATLSKAGRSRSGPEGPKPDIEQ